MMSAKLRESGSQGPSRSESPIQKPAGPGAMTNCAAASKSPYVLSQRTSAVNWQLFTDDAINRSRADNKLIFLHIGFTASHPCHLTIQESFSNRKIIDILNKYFIPIIIDREERPDLDNIFMNYIHSLNSVAGHPLNVFLTPDLEPVFGGTYWPGPGSQLLGSLQTETGEEPADFCQILEHVKDVWANQENRVREDGRSSVVNLRNVIGEGTLSHDFATRPAKLQAGLEQLTGDLDLDQLEEAYDTITKTFDQTYGGFIHFPSTAFPSGKVDVEQLEEAYDYIKNTPKFLTSAKLSFLLRATQYPRAVIDVVGGKLSKQVSDFGLQCLRRIIAGGIHDQLGGGLHRSSATRDWSLPTFEKMLSDNALMLGVFLDAWLLNGADPRSEFAGIVFELADFLTTSPVLSEHGGFATSLAAYSSNSRSNETLRSGAYYLWTLKEFDTVIGDEQTSAVAAAYWDVDEHGNVDPSQDPCDDYLNQNVLRVVKTAAELSTQFGIPENKATELIESAKTKLRAHRDKARVPPTVDAKIVTAYNGMAIISLARTAAVCQSLTGPYVAKSKRYVEAAKQAAIFIKRELWDGAEKTLYRMYYNGRADTKAFAEDYAFLIEGLLELYEATGDEEWLKWADELQATQLLKFFDHPTPHPDSATNSGCGAFYSTVRDAPNIMLRIKDAMDTSQPSANAVSALNLFRLGSLLADPTYTYHAKKTVNAFEAEMLQYPYLFPGLLSSLVAWKLGGKRWVAIGSTKEIDTVVRQNRLRPRGELVTTLFYDERSTGSVFTKSRSPMLAERLAILGRDGSGIYVVKEDGTLTQAR